MTVVITQPSAGSALSGLASVNATYDGKNFQVATLTVDGKQVASASSLPLAFSFDTRSFPDGGHTLTVAVRYGTAGGRYRWQKASVAVSFQNAVLPPSQSSLLLRWAPLVYPGDPGLRVIQIANDGSNRSQSIPLDTDYVLVIDDYNPTVANLGGITITGGRNGVCLGGRIRIDNIAASPSQSTQTAIKVRGGAGVLHFEGLDVGGRNLCDVVALQTISGAGPGTKLRFQNCRFENALPVGTTIAGGFHPDCVQHQAETAPGYPGEVGYDLCTFTSVYQGIFMKGPVRDGVEIHRVNIHPKRDVVAGKTAHFLFWQETSDIAVRIPDNDLYIEENMDESNYGFGNSIYPQLGSGRGSGIDAPTITTDASGTYATLPAGSGITGRVYKGNPPAGDFCPVGVPGIGYQSPGYA